MPWCDCFEREFDPRLTNVKSLNLTVQEMANKHMGYIPMINLHYFSLACSLVFSATMRELMAHVLFVIKYGACMSLKSINQD